MLKHFSTALLTLALALSASAQTAPTGSWTAKADGISPFGYGGYATNGTYLYVFGGQAYSGVDIDSTATTYCRRFDPVANVWSAMADLPGQVHYNTGAYYNGDCYSIGNIGYPPAPGGAWVTVPANAIMRYSIANNTWVILTATIPAHSYMPQAATFGSKIYITGGVTGYTTQAVSEYDPVADTVTAKAASPIGWRNHSMVTNGTKIYVFGGYTRLPGATTSLRGDDTYEYTPATDTWVKKADMLLGFRNSTAAFALGNRIYLTGGMTGAEALPSTATTTSDVLEYNPSTDTWAQRASFSLARTNHAAATIGGKGYIFGGTVPNASGLPSPWTSTQEFTMGDFGSAPTVTTVEQAVGPTVIPQGASVTAGDVLRFVAHTSDPDVGTNTLEVQVKPAADLDWSGAVTLSSGPQTAGDVSIDYPVAILGSYDWRWRVSDNMGNFAGAGPAWTNYATSATSPDFKVVAPVITPPPSGGGDSGGGGGGGGCSVSGPSSGLAVLVILAVALMARRN